MDSPIDGRAPGGTRCRRPRIRRQGQSSPWRPLLGRGSARGRSDAMGARPVHGYAVSMGSPLFPPRRGRAAGGGAAWPKRPSWEGQSPPSQPRHLAIFGSRLLCGVWRCRGAAPRALGGCGAVTRLPQSRAFYCLWPMQASAAAEWLSAAQRMFPSAYATSAAGGGKTGPVPGRTRSGAGSVDGALSGSRGVLGCSGTGKSVEGRL